MNEEEIAFYMKNNINLCRSICADYIMRICNNIIILSDEDVEEVFPIVLGECQIIGSMGLRFFGNNGKLFKNELEKFAKQNPWVRLDEPFYGYSEVFMKYMHPTMLPVYGLFYEDGRENESKLVSFLTSLLSETKAN